MPELRPFQEPVAPGASAQARPTQEPNPYDLLRLRETRPEITDEQMLRIAEAVGRQQPDQPWTLGQLPLNRALGGQPPAQEPGVQEPGTGAAKAPSLAYVP